MVSGARLTWVVLDETHLWPGPLVQVPLGRGQTWQRADVLADTERYPRSGDVR